MATDKVAYWLDIADYDLDTAEAMYQTGRRLYVAFFSATSSILSQTIISRLATLRTKRSSPARSQTTSVDR